MEFEFNEDFPSAKRIKKRIFDIETAIKYTKKTVRLHQNKKRLILLNEELQKKIYHYNKFELFNYIESKVTSTLEKEIADWFKD